MTKSELRKHYKAKRQELSLKEIEDKSLAIANHCLELPIWKRSLYSLYLSIRSQKEVDTDYLLTILQGKDKDVCLSKSDFTHVDMEHFLLTDNTRIEVNRWGIPEPISGIKIQPEVIDVVFVPLLAYDENGNRVGYGKGFYDRFLEACKPNVIKIGLSFFPPEKDAIKASHDDIPLDYCVTPKRIYQF